MTAKNDLSQTRTDYALERTHMAATRTYFALLRTGIAIAGGGTLITTILGDGWPDWLIGALAGLFIIVGFTIMIAGLQRYIFIADKLAGNDESRYVHSGSETQCISQVRRHQGA